MSTAPLDSAGSLSPLDLLAPPPTRSASSDDSFARLFNKPADAPARPADDRSRAGESGTPPRDTARADEGQRSRSESAAQSDKASTASNSRTDADNSANADDSAGATDGSSNQDDADTKTAEEVAEAKTDNNSDEDAAAEEADVAAELCLTNVVEPVAPLAKIESGPEAEEQVAAGGVAKIADEDGKKAKLVAAKAPRGPAPGAAAFELQAKDGAGKAEVDASAALVEDVVDATASKEALVASDVVVAAQAEDIAAAGASGKTKATKVPADDKAATEAKESALDVTAAVAADDASEKSSRDDKRDPGERRNELYNGANADPVAATEATTTATAPAIDATTTVAPPTVQDAVASAPVVNAPPPTAAPTANSAVDASGSPQRLPQHLLARGTSKPSGGAPANPADQARFVARVAKAFQTAQTRDGELQLRLSPAALGSLKLEIKVQDGVMNARIEAETANAKSMLIDNLPALKERLAEQGIVVEKFDVDLMDRQPQREPDSPQERERRQLPRAPHQLKASDTPITTSTTDARTNRGDGRLNVTV